MNIRGIYKTSLIDFPGRISTVLFSGGCNLRCKFCHNADLACNREHLDRSSNDEALAILNKRKHLIDGVTLSGGEPTLSANLEGFIEQIRGLSLPVKLDSNGLRPDVIGRLIARGLIDYVAIDVKTSPRKYPDLAGCAVDFGAIAESVAVLRQSGMDYEIRTTCIPDYVTMEDLGEIAACIGRVKSWWLQQFVSDLPLLDESLRGLSPYPVPVLHRFRDFIAGHADFAGLRGV